MNAQGEALMCARVCPIAEGKKRTRGAVLGADSDYLCTAHPDDCLAKLLIGNVRLVIMAWLLIVRLAVHNYIHK